MAAFLLVKIAIFLALLISILWIAPARADFLSLDVGDEFGYYTPEGGYTSINGPYKGFCTHRYERLFEGQVYQCISTKAVWYSIGTGSSTEIADSNAWAKYQCWNAMYSAMFALSSSASVTSGLILKQSYDFSPVKPSDANFAEPCKLKLVTPGQQTCNIDTQSIINLAFSQKFPLDLFIGVQGFSSPSSCPQFTIRNQTFQLCYITKLVKSLKYVLLLVFVISSIIAL